MTTTPDACILAGGLYLAAAQYILNNPRLPWSAPQFDAATRAIADAVVVFGFADEADALTYPCAEPRTGYPVPAGWR